MIREPLKADARRSDLASLGVIQHVTRVCDGMGRWGKASMQRRFAKVRVRAYRSGAKCKLCLQDSVFQTPMPQRPQFSTTPRQALSILLADGCVDKALHRLAKDRDAVLYAGIGLAGRALSEGLAIDVLSLLSLTEHLRRHSKRGQATVLIADTNAVAAGYPSALVDELAMEYTKHTRALCAHMKSSIEVKLASEWSLLASAHPPLPRAAMMTAPYVRVQLEQMRALFAHDYRLKVGWRMPGAKRDEQHFDTIYRQHIEDATAPHRLETIYGLAGRSFNASHPRACPYVSYPEQTRILLSSPLTVRSQVGQGLCSSENASRGYRRHLIKIARSLRPLVSCDLAKAPALELLDSFRQAAQSPTS